MPSMSNKERARRALDAMKALGFSKKESAPVLRNLLSLFDNSWEPIEDESYRALADAILDSRDRHQNNGEQEQERGGHSTEVAPPREDDHILNCTPLATIASSCDLDSEAEEPLIRTSAATTNFSVDHRSIAAQGDTMPISPRGASTESNRLRTRASSRSRQCMEDGSPSSVPPHKKAKQMMDEDFQHAVFLKEPKPEPDVDGIQYNKASVSSSQNDQVGIISYQHNISSPSGAAYPLASIPPDQHELKSSGSKGRADQCYTRRPASNSSIGPTNTRMKQPQEQENDLCRKEVMQEPGPDSAVKNTLEAHLLQTVVASSTAGEVKLSINHSIDPSNFHMPDLEAVFKMVEDKYKVIAPNFSIGSLMNEICHCAAQMGKADAVDNGRNLQNGPMIHNAPFMETTACTNSVSEKDHRAKESLVMEASRSGAPNATVAQHPHLTLSRLRPIIHDVCDISKGEEKVRISVVNEYGGEKYPSFFCYTPRNLVYRKAHVNISVAKIGDMDCCADCFGNCLSAPVPCPCAREPGDEFAYTQDGLVRTAFLDECFSMTRFPEKRHKFFCTSCLLERSRNEASPEPCKGHLVRKFIKECWTKCGCNMQCGNRVVQRGMTCNLQVFFTEGKGWGVRTLDELPKGAFVCEYVGELLTITELHERISQNKHDGRFMSPVLLDANWGSEGVLKDEEALCMDATFYGNVGRFINHRCYDANLVEIPVEVETPDRHYYRLALFTTRKVEAFEELTWDYGIDFDNEKHPIKAFECLCGSKYCRGRKRERKRGKAGAK